MNIDRKLLSEGDVLSVNFPFNDKIGFKRRPAVITRVSGNKIFLAKITSQIKNHPNNITLQNYTVAGLHKASQVQCNREVSLNRYSHNLIKKIGHLEQHDLEQVNNKIQSIRLARYNVNNKSVMQQYCDKKATPTLSNTQEHDKELNR